MLKIKKKKKKKLDGCPPQKENQSVFNLGSF